MNEVIIAGIGQTPVKEHWDTSLRELALQAIGAARQDAGGLQPQALFVGNMLAPEISRQAHLGALIADFAGLTGIEARHYVAALWRLLRGWWMWRWWSVLKSSPIW
jgi:acetyl-CoA C-acetyltransferase